MIGFKAISLRLAACYMVVKMRNFGEIFELERHKFGHSVYTWETEGSFSHLSFIRQRIWLQINTSCS